MGSGDEGRNAGCAAHAQVRAPAAPEACEPRRLKTARREKGAQLQGGEEVPDGAWKVGCRVEEEVPGADEVLEDFEGFGWRDHCAVLLWSVTRSVGMPSVRGG